MKSKLKKMEKPFAVFSMEADTDYLLARAIDLAGHGFASRAGYFAHQACEKYLKAVTVQSRQEYLESHKLLDLAEECAKDNALFAEADILKTLKIFDEFEQVGRYGGAANFDPKAQKTSELETAGVMLWRGDYIHKLDDFVFRTRSLFDYGKIGHADAFRMIMAGDKRHRYSWSLRPPIPVILTKNNRSFKRMFT